MTCSQQENPNPIDSGFFTSPVDLTIPQKPPFTMMKQGPLLSALDRNYQDGKAIPCFVNKVDKKRFPEVWESVESSHDFQRRQSRGLACSEAERIRLVKASKCPTPLKQPEKYTDEWFQALKFQRIGERSEQERQQRKSDQWFVEQRIKTAEQVEVEQSEAHRAKVKTAPLAINGVDTETGEILPRKAEGEAGQLFTVITHREWSDEFRIRTQVDQCSALPPEQSGERESTTLSMNGAKKIADSCHFMHLKKGGYKTFLTLTIEPEKRQLLEDGEISFQKEISRFWDAMNQIRKRGFGYELPSGEKRRIKGVAGRKILYCWVIENPVNDNGERNPHVHILMDWGVPYGPEGCVFQAWAKRVEGVWKNGYAHLEKMKDTANAGAYMAKAAGYLSKGQGAEDQGPVKGNRYGISSESRAPEWVQVGRYEAAHMGHLIKDVHDFFGHLYGPVFAKRKELNKALEETPKTEKKKRHAIGKALAKVREKCNALPAIAGKYQLMIKGREKFNEFMAWASSDKAEQPTEWLPPKDANEGWDGTKPRPDSNWFKEFQLQLFNRKAKRRWDRMKYEPFAEQELSKPKPEKPTLFDWFSYEKWSVTA